MMEFLVDKTIMNIKDDDFKRVCAKFKSRIITILYLKEDLDNKRINPYDFESYIDVLNSDLYGAYKLFNNSNFINCSCELEGIKYNYEKSYFRKKVLDIANYIGNIPCDRKGD